MNKQHVQLPNNMTLETILTPQDLLVYISIKRYMNNETKEAFPSLQTIAEKCGASIPTIRKCIKRLEEGKYIEVTKKGRSQIYKFLKYDNFEPFSYEFLDKEDLSFTEKSYIIASQQYMFKENGKGKIGLSNQELGNKINMPKSTVTKCNKTLEAKGYLDIIKARKHESGITINEKFFHLDELGQAIVFTLQNHEERLNKTEQNIENLMKDMSIVLKENKELKERLKELELLNTKITV